MRLLSTPSQPARHSQREEPDPGDVERLARQAAMLAGRDEPQKALCCLQLALLVDETRGDIWFDYGTLQRKLGMKADAIESFEFALRQEPSLYAARYSLARLRCETGRPLEALAHLRQLTEEKPRFAAAWHQLVRLSLALGDEAAAARYAREALAHLPGDAELGAMMGWTSSSPGQTATA